MCHYLQILTSLVVQQSSEYALILKEQIGVRNKSIIIFFPELTGMSDPDSFKTVILLGFVIQLHICSILA